MMIVAPLVAAKSRENKNKIIIYITTQNVSRHTV
jgi:hypothetical protein